MFDDVLFYKVTLNFTRRCGQGGQEATLFALLRLFNTINVPAAWLNTLFI